jgi:hypothetical protein
LYDFGYFLGADAQGVLGVELAVLVGDRRAGGIAPHNKHQGFAARPPWAELWGFYISLFIGHAPQFAGPEGCASRPYLYGYGRGFVVMAALVPKKKLSRPNFPQSGA